MNRSGTEARSDGFFRNDVGGSRHLTALQHVGQVLGLLCREVTADLRNAAGNFVLDVGGTVHHAVEYDGHGAFDVALRDGCPFAGAVGRHRHRNDGAVVLVILVLRRGDHFTGQGCLAVGATQCIEFEQALFGARAPSEVEVGGQHLCGQFGVDGAVNRRRVECRGIAHYTVFRVAGLNEEAEQGVCLEGSFACLVGRCGSLFGFAGVVLLSECLEGVGCRSLGVSHGFFFRAVYLCCVGLRAFVAGSRLCQARVEGSEGTLDVTIFVGFPKLEVGATLEELAHTLRLFDTGHFDHDLAHLSATFEDLDVGLCHTEAVDTLAHHLIGVVNRRLDFFFEGGFHLRVRAVGGDTFFLEFKGEDTAELVFTHFLLVETHEDIEEVIRRILGFCASFVHDLLHLRVVGVAAGQVLHNVGNRHFENDVHTAFQVETQTDLEGFA